MGQIKIILFYRCRHALNNLFTYQYFYLLPNSLQAICSKQPIPVFKNNSNCTDCATSTRLSKYFTRVIITHSWGYTVYRTGLIIHQKTLYVIISVNISIINIKRQTVMRLLLHNRGQKEKNNQ